VNYFSKAPLLALLVLPACYADTVTLFFTALPSANENGSYNGFSTAKVNGVPSQMMICDDYFDETMMPSSSNLIYDFSSIGGSTPLQHAMFATSTPAANTKKYEEAAVLVYQLAELGSSATANQATDYNYALWNLMAPSAPLDPSRVSQEQALQTSALAMINDATQTSFLQNTVYNYTRIYTPTAAFSGNQEFLQYAAPEPSLGWLAAALLALTFAFRKRLGWLVKEPVVARNPRR
jgi:hypothetical protein